MKWGLVLHGGAGTISRDKLTPEREAVMRADLERALREAHGVLAAGGSSADAVTAAIVILEDSPYFNAGKGAVFTHDGVNELDAAIMVGKTRAAGAVAGVRTVKNPIKLARAVMEEGRHVMLSGAGADAFARVAGVETVDPSYFRTEERWQELQQALKEDKFGTVGVVALDKAGGLAAGTSTGGLTNKRWGRVGDSPIIGAGTYADDRCGVSATGHGELFIRYTVARDICARVEYSGVSLAQAAHDVVEDELVKAQGEGGVIAMDAQGHWALTFNTPGMYRGYITDEGIPHVDIYR
ncbi:MAG TPA: isoaspartyl peptidase/L-asparaginase [Kofleriaceae bacterium]|jgi:beta-aspartyl-peptidase (threonine type)|nr:isoaspartyl peptidase/L-asparaginase [Kofleriaceae bacterium]